MLDKQKTHTKLGVLVGAQVYYNTILGNFVGPVLYGIRSAAIDYGCNLLIAGGMEDYTVLSRSAWPQPTPETDFVPVGPWNTDGLIVVNPLFSEGKSAYIQNVRKSGTPVVYLSTGEDGPTVCVDNEAGIRQALAHLLEHGHQEIAFIAGYPQGRTGDSALRLRAYQESIQAMGLLLDPRLIAFGYHSIEGGKTAMQQLFDTGVKFTAVLASNDESAVGAMDTIKSAGLRIPEDIAIVGFDDNLEALVQIPPLTTLHYSPSEMGYMAVEVLLEHIAGRKPHSDVLKIPARMVCRQSCGCQGDAIPEKQFEMSRAASCDRVDAMTQIVRTMTESAMKEAQHLNPAEVHALCSHLIEALLSSLKCGQATEYYRVLQDVCCRSEAANEDVHLWYAALSGLEDKTALLSTISRPRLDLQQTQDILRHSRFVVNESIRRQSRRYLIEQRRSSDWVDRLNASLLAASDRTQIFEILAEHFPRMGIHHAGIVFLQPDGDDPVAQSELHVIGPRQGERVTCFPSRQFPPPGLFPEPFSLILLPLSQQGEAPGFAVFDTSNLELHAHIVWQLRTFFKITASRPSQSEIKQALASPAINAPAQADSKNTLPAPRLHLGDDVRKSARPDPILEPISIRKLPVLPSERVVSSQHPSHTADLVSQPSLNFLYKPAGMAELTQAVERCWTDNLHKQNERILIVDDDPRILETFTRMLKSCYAQVDVLTAQNGMDALALIRGRSPGLVLLDLGMPDLDGFAVLEIIRSDAEIWDTPVVILSGQKLTQETMTRLSTGVDSILHKDLYSPAEVSEHIEAVLHGEKSLNFASQKLARKAMAYLHEKYGEPISLGDVAAHFGVCKEHLARSFRRETGMTLGTYLNRYRITQAKALLRQGETHVVDIALQVGFSSCAYFSRVFRQETGKSPQAYRQRH